MVNHNYCFEKIKDKVLKRSLSMCSVVLLSCSPLLAQAAALAEINHLRAEHPILLTGRFTGPDGITVETKNGLLAAGYTEGERVAVVVTTPRDRAASGAVSVAGMRPVGGSAAVNLAPNGIVVLEFGK